MVATLRGQAWHPDVTVATVVALKGRLLLVEERIDGQLVLNQPAGHLEPGESLVEAAVRNTVLQLRGIDTYQEFVDRHRRAMEKGHEP